MFVIIWRYKVRDGLETEFEHMYGVRGEWVDFFKAGEGYLGTKLLRPAGDDWYATLDRWESRSAYESFTRTNLERYNALDTRCEMMMLEEERVGEFEDINEERCNG